MVSIIARPTNKVRDKVPAELRLPGDRVHRGGDRPPFAESWPDRTERDGQGGCENADDLNSVVHDVPRC